MNVEMKTINYDGAIVTISSDGKTVIWNNDKRNIYINEDGYSVCAIKLPNRGWRSVSIARLVAIAFIPNPDNLPEVNHKDYNRSNASVENLEWITHADNIRYSLCNRPDYCGEKNPNYGNHILSKRYAEDKDLAKKKQGRKGLRNGRVKSIALYDSKGELIKKFDYIKLLCEYLIDNNICTCLKSKDRDTHINSVRSQINRCLQNDRLYKKMYRFKLI